MIKWKNVKKELPSIKNGQIDMLVLVCVKNKNKENGICLFDICSFDGRIYCFGVKCQIAMREGK